MKKNECCCLLCCCCIYFLLSAVPRAPPTQIRVSNISSDSAVVSWKVPPIAFNNGPLTGYHVLFQSVFTVEGFFVNWTNQTAGDVTHFQVKQLRLFQRYMVAVAAATAEGRGPLSTSIEFTTGQGGGTLYTTLLCSDIVCYTFS